jgi:hypothetical protein
MPVAEHSMFDRPRLAHGLRLRRIPGCVCNATIAFFIPRCLQIFIAQPLSQDIPHPTLPDFTVSSVSLGIVGVQQLEHNPVLQT